MKLVLIISTVVVISAIAITIVLLVKPKSTPTIKPPTKPPTPGSMKLGQFCNDDNVKNHCIEGLSCNPVSEKLVVGVGSGNNTLAYSTDDGKTWIGLGTDVFSVQGNRVAAGKSEFVAVGRSDANRGSVAHSIDGKNWTSYKTLFGAPKTIGESYNVAYLKDIDGGRYVVTGDMYDGHNMAFSLRNADGMLSGFWGLNLVGWTKTTAVAASDKIFLIVGMYDKDVYKKIDMGGRVKSNTLVAKEGQAWGSIADTTLHPTNDIAYGAGKFVAVGEPLYTNDDKSKYAAICASGQTATSDLNPCSSNTGVKYYDGPCPVGPGGKIPDVGTGKNYWQTVNGVKQGIGYGIAYGKDKFVMVGKWGTGTNTNTIYYSTDGVDWKPSHGQKILGTGRGVSWVGDKFIAFGDAGTGGSNMAYSPDGINWTPQPNTPFSVGYGGGSNYQTTHKCEKSTK